MAQFSNHLKILPTKPTTKIQEAKFVERPRYVTRSVRKREVGVTQASQPHFITVPDFSRFSRFFSFFKFFFYDFQDFFAFFNFFSRFSRFFSFFKIFRVFQLFSRFSSFFTFFKIYRLFQDLTSFSKFTDLFKIYPGSSFSRFIETKEKLRDDTHRTR